MAIAARPQSRHWPFKTDRDGVERYGYGVLPAVASSGQPSGAWRIQRPCRSITAVAVVVAPSSLSVNNWPVRRSSIRKGRSTFADPKVVSSIRSGGFRTGNGDHRRKATPVRAVPGRTGIHKSPKPSIRQPIAPFHAWKIHWE